MKQLTVFLLITAFASLTGCIPGKTEEKIPVEPDTIPYGIYDRGRNRTPVYFKKNCAACHMLDKDLTGPALKGMMDRIPGREWLKSYLMDERSLLEAGDTTALRISKQSPFEPFHQFSSLTDEALDELIHYTKSI